MFIVKFLALKTKDKIFKALYEFSFLNEQHAGQLWILSLEKHAFKRCSYSFLN